MVSQAPDPASPGADDVPRDGADAIESALDRAERALSMLESTIDAFVAQQAHAAEMRGQDDAIDGLQTRHRKLKEKVAQELRQLDLLLANLPGAPAFPG